MTQAGLGETTGYHLFGNCHREPPDFPKHLTMLGNAKQAKEKARLAAGLGMLNGLGSQFGFKSAHINHVFDIGLIEPDLVFGVMRQRDV